ncbi:flavin monoamine oxidase family protein [Aquimarina rhabdastrellae]
MKKIVSIMLLIIMSSCSVLKQKAIIKEKKQIVIVGAGISGLSAAHYLKKKGYNPIILEAQAKVGGRLKTDRSLGIAFDEGASWIHGPKKNPITKLAKEAGTKTFLTNDDNIKTYDKDGKIYNQRILNNAEERYNTFLDEVEGKQGESFADIFYKMHPNLKENRLWTYMLSAFLEFDTGGDIHKLSSTSFYDDKAFKGEDLIITNGYDKITDYLAHHIDIRFNTVVESIDYRESNVIIKTNRGDFSAEKVLVTVPLGVLKKKKIEFKPSLPAETQKAIDDLEMGSVNKFLLVWDKAFWDEDVQYIGYTPVEKGKFNYFLNVKKFTEANALMTFAFGDYAIETEKMTNEQLIEEMIVHLRTIYGKEIPKPRHFLRTKWNNNKYSYGAYSFPDKISGSAAYDVFKKPIKNKIFFAGEHTIKAYRGTVHGAYLSGIREAKKLLKKIK